ncbi:hypothetical protein OPV22_021301 [Ensete ventricosum]|uniref:Uncharacterized protein n=1 Tax=Ensete ventricosum TaxID=4639 RepID=A0AAV8QCP2_ENSVE|nr:hypothetical protein OPV22_021301 [Ensete ventricosum]
MVSSGKERYTTGGEGGDDNNYKRKNCSTSARRGVHSPVGPPAMMHCRRKCRGSFTCSVKVCPSLGTAAFAQPSDSFVPSPPPPPPKKKRYHMVCSSLSALSLSHTHTHTHL